MGLNNQNGRSLRNLRNRGLTAILAARVAVFRLIRSGMDRAKLADHTFNVIVAVVIGILGGLGAVAFHYLINTVQNLSWGMPHPSVEYFFSLPLAVRILIPAAGGLVIGPLVYVFAREAKGHGVPEVMESVALKGGIMRARVVLAKFIGSAITIGTGGSAGREGPIVQIGAAVGSVVGQFLRVSVKRIKTYVGCGAAAGIAATFNAPLAGSLFAVEVILGDFGVHQFSPIVISSVVATVVSRHFLGNFPAFIPPHYQLVSPWELIAYLILGLVAALVAIGFTRVLYWSEDLFGSMRALPGPLRPALGGLLVGCVAIVAPQVYGSGYESVDLALDGRLAWTVLATLLVCKLVATSLTLGSGGSGGIFAPSLFLGAMTGGLFGTVAHRLFPTLTASPGAYALVGMGALVAGTTRAPITAILIIFEMTNEYSIILPLMGACIISTLCAGWLSRESIYTLKLIRRGVDLFQGRELNVLKSINVKDVMVDIAEIIPRDLSLPAMIDRMTHSPNSYFYILDESGKLSGSVAVNDLKQLFRDESSLSDLIVAQDLASPEVSTVTPDQNLDLVMRLFGRDFVEEIPVIDSEEGRRVIGTVHRSHVIEAYNRAIFDQDPAGTMAANVAALEGSRLQSVTLAEGYTLSEIEAPGVFEGKTIRELDVRANYGVEILLIKSPTPGRAEAGGGAQLKKVPKPDVRIHRHDVLLIAGEVNRIEQLKKL